jgi:hypothetical protein
MFTTSLNSAPASFNRIAGPPLINDQALGQQPQTPFVFVAMCQFCGNLGHSPARIDPRPMSELHLTEAEYADYKSHSSSDTLYKRLEGNDCPKLRVIGFPIQRRHNGRFSYV